MPYLSLIIPVYNRPQEVKELLESLSLQKNRDFEVIIVEDGSSVRCEDIVKQYKEQLNISYFFKSNSGRSLSRNYGMERASGDYFVFFDSDCIVPPDYFQKVNAYLESKYVDCYGGPDSAHQSFSDFQKAVNYSMTSFFTTGGIRGKKKSFEKFVPRTFNMGFSRKVYQTVGGFKDMLGEDIDLSIRIKQAGFTIALFPEAFVYHKRRVGWKSFYHQVYVFGMGRIDLFLLYPDSLKLVYCLPAFAVIGAIGCICIAVFYSVWALFPFVLFAGLVFGESWIKNKNIHIALLSIATSAIQLGGYGWGFLTAFLQKVLFGKKGNQQKLLEKHYKKK